MKLRNMSVLLVSLSTTAFGAECSMPLKFFRPDEKGTTQVKVLADNKMKSVFFESSLKINTDGTKRSYKVTDFWERRARSIIYVTR